MNQEEGIDDPLLNHVVDERGPTMLPPRPGIDFAVFRYGAGWL